VVSPETRYELGKLRIQHDRWVNAIYRRHGIVTDDPELTYHLDALDAIIELTQPEENANVG
jgi:hypothetical protein